MANPQTDRGHVRIANDLYEALYAFDFTSRELRLLLAIIRETYGWGRKEHQMSVTTLASMTGIDRSHANRVMRGLQEKNVVRCISEPTFQFSGIYGLQKDWEQWDIELLGERPSVGEAKRAPVAESATGAKSAHPQVPKVPIPCGQKCPSNAPANADEEGIVGVPKDSTKAKGKPCNGEDEVQALLGIALNIAPSGLKPAQRQQIVNLARRPESLETKLTAMREAREETMEVLATGKTKTGEPVLSPWSFFIHLVDQRILKHQATLLPQKPRQSRSPIWDNPL